MTDVLLGICAILAATPGRKERGFLDLRVRDPARRWGERSSSRRNPSPHCILFARPWVWARRPTKWPGPRVCVRLPRVLSTGSGARPSNRGRRTTTTFMARPLATGSHQRRAQSRKICRVTHAGQGHLPLPSEDPGREAKRPAGSRDASSQASASPRRVPEISGRQESGFPEGRLRESLERKDER
jgi:hypothetical protein